MNKKIQSIAAKAGVYYYRKGKLQADTENLVKAVAEELAKQFPHQFTDEQYQRRIDKTILNYFEDDNV